MQQRALNWKQRLDQDPSLKDTKSWADMSVINSLAQKKRVKSLRNLKMYSKAANGQKLKDVAHEFNLTPASVSILMTNILGGPADAPPALMKGVIHMARKRKDRRRKAFSDLQNTCGARCLFAELLATVPGLKNYLSEWVKLYVNKAPHAENLTPTSFHNKFIQYLCENHWPQDRYPFDQVKQGYESCRKYFHELVAEHSIPKAKNEFCIRELVSRAFGEVQIDSQTLDISVSELFEYERTIIPERLSRMTLFIAIDVATDCILAYKLCFSDSPTQYDLLDLLISINKKWKPRKLTTPELFYEPGACLPSSLGETYQNAGIGIVSLDNALCHHSHLVRNYICEDMAATINFGLPANPKSRNTVEFAFRRLNRYLHRFASTTGSHPKDPVKESLSNAKKPPVLTLSALEDILSVVLTSHNNRPQNRLMGHCPLSAIKSDVSTKLIRINHNIDSGCSNPYEREKIVNVCWSAKEKRIPYVHFEGVRYSAMNVLGSELVKKKIIIKYDMRDIRHLTAFTLKGKKLGILNAPSTWQVHKHNVDTRKYVISLVKQKLISGNDPLHGVFSYLYKHKSLPSEALNLTGLVKDVTAGINNTQPKNDNQYSTKSPVKPKPNKILKWTPRVFKQGKPI